MTLRCIIVDDELPSLDELSHLLSEMDGVDVLACENSGKKALTKIKELRPDVVFLDIKMPGLNGFDVAKEILTFKETPLIVFATAYDEYAVKAFDINAIDYILKPFSKKRLTSTVQRIKQTKTKGLDQSDLKEIIERLGDRSPVKEFVRVSVLKNGRIMLISPEDIFFCSAHEGKSSVHIKERSFPSPATLNELANHLRADNFFRVHRSFLVNLRYIKDIVPWFNGKYLITMQDNQSTEITVSRNNVKPLKKILAL
ncbi:MAG: response regulator transcription factor [Deltaproteobacteria bacterium]|nr:response regulator transcription factor [Deltaproteobacteria bacterium]MBW2119947.1 response regulator transcription factor [Deltaproteobacteria bacterium]MBW2345090.1 response regulator transcription factor [Deltaproteobacteria bacterium]